MKLCKEITSINVDDQIILINSEVEKVYVFEDTGKDILEYLLNDNPLDSIYDTLSQKYEISVVDITADIDEFIEELISLGLFEKSNNDNWM